MKRLAILCALALASPAAAALSERELAAAVARPPADARLPGRLAFRSEGGPVTLDRVADGRPLVLIFADFTCRHVCSPGLALTAGALAGAGLVAGRDYRVAVIGIDPRDPLADGRPLLQGMRADPAVARATTVLTGDPRTIAAATQALGYRYVYDRDNDQFAHDAVVYVFAPDGRLSAMLPEIGLAPQALRAALSGSAPLKSQSLAEQVAHLCYGFAAAHGRWGRPVVLALQALSLLLLAGVAALAFRRRHAS